MARRVWGLERGVESLAVAGEVDREAGHPRPRQAEEARAVDLLADRAPVKPKEEGRGAGLRAHEIGVGEEGWGGP